MTTIQTEPEQLEAVPIRGLSRLTVADGLLLIPLLAAAAIRLAQLGQIPLSPAEAEEALRVWHFWRPGGTIMPGSFSPAYFSLTALLTQVLGTGDAVMRLVPALFGAGMTLLPWLLRRHLGSVAVLATSLLLAVSPTGVAVGRTAGGQSIALFAVLLLAIAWLRYQESGRPHWFYTAMGALALGVASEPLFYTGLLAVAVAWLLQHLFGPRLTPGIIRPDRPALRQGALVAAAVFFSAGTLFLWNPAGLSGTATVAARWLTQFGLSGQLLDWAAPLLALARYETILLTLGVVAIAWAIWEGRPLAGFFVYWFSLSLVLLFLQQGHLENLLLLTLPGYLLIGLMVGRVWGQRVNLHGWLLAAAILLVSALAYFNLIRYSRIGGNNPEQLYYLWLPLIAITIMIVAVSYIQLFDHVAARQGTLLGLLMLFVLYNTGTAWWLGHEGANDPRERWVTAATDDELPLLVETLRQVARQANNSSVDLDVLSAVDSPVLRWYLRDIRNLQIGATVPPGTRNEVIIAPAAAVPALGAEYFRDEFGLLRGSPAPPPAGERLQLPEFLRWWWLRQSPLTIAEERVAVWIRADLAD